MKLIVCITSVALVSSSVLSAQESPLPPVQKVRNYLPHMTVPEVQDFLTRSDMVIIPVGSIEQHGLHLPIGTDYLNGVERAKLIAQRVDVLVAPILFPGQSPYHMGFEGTVTLPSTLIQEVYVEAAKSLMRHGFTVQATRHCRRGAGRGPARVRPARRNARDVQLDVPDPGARRAGGCGPSRAHAAAALGGHAAPSFGRRSHGAGGVSR